MNPGHSGHRTMFVRGDGRVFQTSSSTSIPRSQSANAIICNIPTPTSQSSAPAMKDSGSNDEEKNANASTAPSSSETEGEFPDDDDDWMMIQATQATEIKIGLSKTALEDDPTAATPLENFNYERQLLVVKEQRDQQNANATQSASTRYDESVLTQSQRDPSRGNTEEFYRLKGENTNLRRSVAGLEQEVQQLIAEKLNGRKIPCDEKMKLEDEIRNLKGEVTILKATQMSQKSRRSSVSSVRWSQPQRVRKEQEELNASADYLMSIHEASPPLPPPVPGHEGVAELTRPPLTVRKTVQSSKEVQTGASPMAGGNEDKSSETLDWSSSSRNTRERILEKINEVVELSFQIVQPKLEKFAKEAPKEIMRKWVPRIEIKNAFPDVVDTMFQWSVEQERKRNRTEKEIKPPILPAHAPLEEGARYLEIQNCIFTTYRCAGTWGALLEVRTWLEKILHRLTGEGRFRLYEFRTLSNFWRLLLWAKELWRCVLLEEENVELVRRTEGKWRQELELWTGIILKADWRDYVVEDLEKEVRFFTLDILEKIATAGYFEQKVNRFYVLYCVMKDTLIKDAFRTVDNVRRVLQITTRLLPERLMMKRMCYMKNEVNTCLARILGENVLKLCREEHRPMAVALLFLDYVYLLESLMREKPLAQPISSYARKEEEEPERPRSPPGRGFDRVLNMDDSMMMTDDIPSTQFACTIKYDIPASAPEPELMEIDDENPIWLDTANYEDPNQERKCCQCRKTLIGTAVILFQMVVEAWMQRYLDYEKYMEHLEEEEINELVRLEQKQSSPDCLTSDEKDYIKHLQQKKLLAKTHQTKAAQYFEQKCPLPEWSWDDVLKHSSELITDEDLSSIPATKRPTDVFDQVLSKGLVLLSFFAKSDNLAAALGSEAYKALMTLLPSLRLIMDKFDSELDIHLLTSLTPDCEEQYTGSVELHDEKASQSASDNRQLQKPTSPVKLVEHPLPVEPLKELTMEEVDQIDVDEGGVFQNTSASEIEGMHEAYTTYLQSEFVKASNPFTYRLLRPL